MKQNIRRNRLFAVYTLCAHWHSGQWSRGYELLCKTGKRLEKAFGITHPLNTVHDIYTQMAIEKIYKRLENSDITDLL